MVRFITVILVQTGKFCSGKKFRARSHQTDPPPTIWTCMWDQCRSPLHHPRIVLVSVILLQTMLIFVAGSALNKQVHETWFEPEESPSPRGGKLINFTTNYWVFMARLCYIPLMSVKFSWAIPSGWAQCTSFGVRSTWYLLVVAI